MCYVSFIISTIYSEYICVCTHVYGYAFTQMHTCILFFWDSVAKCIFVYMVVYKWWKKPVTSILLKSMTEQGWSLGSMLLGSQVTFAGWGTFVCLSVFLSEWIYSSEVRSQEKGRDWCYKWSTIKCWRRETKKWEGKNVTIVGKLMLHVRKTLIQVRMRNDKPKMW